MQAIALPIASSSERNLSNPFWVLAVCKARRHLEYSSSSGDMCEMCVWMQCQNGAPDITFKSGIEKKNSRGKYLKSLNILRLVLILSSTAPHTFCCLTFPDSAVTSLAKFWIWSQGEGLTRPRRKRKDVCDVIGTKKNVRVPYQVITCANADNLSFPLALVNTINPTNCDSSSINSTLGGISSGIASSLRVCESLLAL